MRAQVRFTPFLVRRDHNARTLNNVNVYNDPIRLKYLIDMRIVLPCMVATVSRHMWLYSEDVLPVTIIRLMFAGIFCIVSSFGIVFIYIFCDC